MAKREKPLFARNLNYLRSQRSLTIREVAKRAGVKFSAWCAWEEGRSSPRLGMVPKVCESLGYYDVIGMLTSDLAKETREPTKAEAIRGLNEVKKYLQTIKETL